MKTQGKSNLVIDFNRLNDTPFNKIFNVISLGFANFVNFFSRKNYDNIKVKLKSDILYKKQH